ncbi:hypothetical protein F4778DRAFT_793902 [Xylariomycetidae sp. FL2044]|nr:hypothetical protein F4778DRAFT_793902 [Xylariomycetidae sp. FL2044]
MRTAFQGVHCAVTPGDIMCTTSRYHALRHKRSPRDDMVWDGFETVWKMQGDGPFSVGDPPTNYDGGSRITPTGARAPLSPLAVEGILDADRRHRVRDGKGNVQLMAILPDEINLSPTGLIRRLAMDIHAEAPDLKFDYFTMPITCWGLPREMKEGYVEIQRDGSSVGAELLKFVPDESKLSLVVGFVFLTAADQRNIKDKGWGVDLSVSRGPLELPQGPARVCGDQGCSPNVTDQGWKDIAFKRERRVKLGRTLAGIKAKKKKGQEPCCQAWNFPFIHPWMGHK